LRGGKNQRIGEGRQTKGREPLEREARDVALNRLKERFELSVCREEGEAGRRPPAETGEREREGSTRMKKLGIPRGAGSKASLKQKTENQALWGIFVFRRQQKEKKKVNCRSDFKRGTEKYRQKQTGGKEIKKLK